MSSVPATGGEKPAGPIANKLDLAGIVALVAPLVATVSLFKATGTIGRLQRDEPVGLMIAIALVLLAGALLTIASYLAGEGQKKESKDEGQKEDKGRWARFWAACEKYRVTTLYALGTILTLAGFFVAMALVVSNSGEQPRPRITASLNKAQSKLTGEVSASNLKTEDRLAIKVDLATLKLGKTLNNRYPFAKRGSLQLVRAFVGPNTDGDVKQVLSVPVPRGGKYTDLVIKAFTGGRNTSCSELPGASGDPGTACMFIAINPARGE